MRFTKSLVIAAIACVTPFATQAAAINTSNLALSIDGLNFSSFTCSMAHGGKAVSPNSCGQIQVNTITNPGTGIRISSGFAAAEYAFTPSMAFDDAVVTYKVNSGTGISQIGLDFNGFYEGYAVTSVVETVFNGNHEIAQADVSCSTFSCNQSTEISLNGSYNNLFVEKDIYVGAYYGLATTSIIDQTFTQAATATPEPSSIALLGSGLVGAGCLLRRRKKAVAPKENA